jgi:hypothetical protein
MSLSTFPEFARMVQDGLDRDREEIYRTRPMVSGPLPPMGYPVKPPPPTLRTLRRRESKEMVNSAPYNTTCPKCEMTKARKARHATAEVNNAYGKVSKDAFFILMKKETDAKEKTNRAVKTLVQSPQTLHLDVNGVLKISFTAYCSVCGLKIKHEQEVKFPAIEDEAYE